MSATLEPPANLPTFAPFSDELLRALDAERSRAYAAGADAVWNLVGCGPSGPNEAVFDAANSRYLIVPKVWSSTPPGKPAP
jgi:hypothetical protein